MCVQCFQEAIVRKVWLEEGICGEKRGKKLGSDCYLVLISIVYRW